MKTLKYPIGVQTFSKIIREGYLYVDKTAYIPRLLESGQYIFLSRPRRFGKSLLLSMLHSYFEGNRELFRGLDIDSMDVEWKKRPVIHIDLNSENYSDRDGLQTRLDRSLREYELSYGVPELAATLTLRFEALLRHVNKSTGERCVVLIDEYDKPLLERGEREETNRSLLKSFYSVLKSSDRHIQFAMLTGVARFSKVSIFSDLNNLRDISFENQFAGICGITSDELDDYFGEGIREFADASGVTAAEIRGRLRKNYDGYHFAKQSPDIYNPFSLLNALGKREFGSYWFETGTPTYLIRTLEKEEWSLREIAPVEIEALRLETAGLLSADPIPVFFQTGYLTIKGYDPEFRVYTLDYPNEEVKDGFLTHLVPYYIKKDERQGQFSVRRFVRAVQEGEPERFMELLGSMLAGVPYSEKGSAESHFQNAAFILFTLMGQHVRLEDRTSDGRIDMTIETGKYVYIFEFKVDSTAREAMKQIREKEYWIKYLGTGKTIYLVGANFSTRLRRLDGYLIDEP